MPGKITVTVGGYGSEQSIELDSGSTVEVAANGGGVSPEAVIRLRGERVQPTQRADVTLEDGDTLVAVPPEAKQGR